MEGLIGVVTAARCVYAFAIDNTEKLFRMSLMLSAAGVVKILKKYNVDHIVFAQILPLLLLLALLCCLLRFKKMAFKAQNNYNKNDTLNIPITEETHRIRVDALEQIIRMELKRIAAFYFAHEDDFIDVLIKEMSQNEVKSKEYLTKKSNTLSARINEINRLCMKIYEDNANGKITDDIFSSLSAKYSDEKKQREEELKKIRKSAKESIVEEESARLIADSVKKFLQFDSLTATVVKTLIERIEVYNTKGLGKNRTQIIAVHFNFITSFPKQSEEAGIVLKTRHGVAVKYETVA